MVFIIIKKNHFHFRKILSNQREGGQPQNLAEVPELKGAFYKIGKGREVEGSRPGETWQR